MRLFLCLIMLMATKSGLAIEATMVSPTAIEATFPGRVSRLNAVAQLMRVRVDFKNAKFLNRADRLDFWNESYPNQRCVAVVEARSNEYLLLRVPEFVSCVKNVHLTTGSFLKFWGQDLENNIKTAHELVEVLLKKRMAMLAKKRRHERDLEAHVERVEIINKRYEVLRQKLEAEWQRELAAQEEDRSNSLVAFKAAETRLNEVDSKLESYRIHDSNFTLDRWSLDPDLYIHK